MSHLETLQSALEQEFSCYYHGDELPSIRSTAFRASLPRRAWASAMRLRRTVGESEVAPLIAVLQSLKAAPYGFLMCSLIEATLIGWPDEPPEWAMFRRLVDEIVAFLQQEPGPRPA